MWKILALISITSLFLACSNNIPESGVSGAPPVADSITYNSFTGNNLRLIGRFDTDTEGQARFTWPGSSIAFRFSGTEAKIAIASNGRTRFLVEVDATSKDLWVDSGDATYTLTTGLMPGEHRVRLTRITESFSVVTTLLSNPVVDGSLLAAPEPMKKHLLVLGDSITAGYGVEGTSQSCSYSADTSNQQLTYAALAAKALNADLQSIAWSGIGAWRSYAEKTPVNPTILERYQRTLADDPNSHWDINLYQPDAIIIAIGTNDYWEGSVSDDYRLAMAELITHIEADYPMKPVYLMVSPMLNGAARESQKSVLDSLATKKVKVVDLGKIEAVDGFGCDYHPNTLTQQRMAKALQTQLKIDFNW